MIWASNDSGKLLFLYLCVLKTIQDEGYKTGGFLCRSI